MEFAGLIANGRVFKSDKGKYVTFVTLGIDNGKYIDVAIRKPLSYKDGDIIVGQGKLRHKNGSDYIEAPDAQCYQLERWCQSS